MNNNSLGFYAVLTLLAVTLLASPAPLTAKQDPQSVLDFFDSPAVTEFVSRAVFEISPASCPIDVLTILDQLGAVALLKEPLYLRTNLLNSRNILDYPLFVRPWPTCENNRFTSTLFYEQMTNGVFVDDKSKINSYLAIGESDFIDKLQEVLQIIQETGFVNFNVLTAIDILALLENFTVQERRMGAMLNYFRQFPSHRLNIMLPLMYVERNHFVNEQVQGALTQITTSLLQQVPEREAQKDFQKCFLISDKMGWGDLRIELTGCEQGPSWWRICPGVFMTIPVAHSFEKGILGNSFPETQCRPLLDLCKILDQQVAGGSFSNTEIPNFFLGALNRLSSLLLKGTLGNDGHLGIGFMLSGQSCLGSFIPRPWAQSIILKNRLSAEYLVPAWKTRSFVTCNAAAGFQGRDFLNAEQANENFSFIVQTITDRFFPFALSAKVHPGVILRSTSYAMYESGYTRVFLGTDWWIQTAEGITSVQGDPCLVGRLNIDKAQKVLAFQSRTTAGIAQSYHRPDYSYTLSLAGDFTSFNSGIGKDFMLSFTIDVDF